MKKISKFIVSGLLVVSPMLFTACNDDNRIGRDKGVPNNIEDNYTGDADHNKTGEHEEEIKQKARQIREDARDIKNSVKSNVKSSVAYNHSNQSLEDRVEKLEKELVELKSKKVGPDRVGNK